MKRMKRLMKRMKRLPTPIFALTGAPAAALAVLIGLGALATACKPSTDAHHPRTALDRYVRAIRDNNPRAAYDLLSKKVKSRISFQAFARKWRKNYPELKIQAAAIAKKRDEDKAYEIRARLALKNRRAVTLAWHKDRWKIVGGVGSGFASHSPREAVLALVRALETRNFSAFLKLLSKPRREKFLRELNLRLDKLKANLDRDFEITGNRARLQYDPQYWIMLVKENGVWRIVEFN
jgi:hypothetical protein